MAAVDIVLPGVPPIDKDGISSEYLRQLETALQQLKDELVATQSQLATRRLQ